MDEPVKACLVSTTTNDAEEARRLADDLVRLGLAACVQVTSVDSHYVWEDRLERQAEYLLLIKTIEERYGQVEAYLRRAHSYSVPEILRFPVSGGSKDYLTWLMENSQARRLPSKEG